MYTYKKETKRTMAKRLIIKCCETCDYYVYDDNYKNGSANRCRYRETFYSTLILSPSCEETLKHVCIDYKYWEQKTSKLKLLFYWLLDRYREWEKCCKKSFEQTDMDDENE